jgi:hypothetical protein
VCAPLSLGRENETDFPQYFSSFLFLFLFRNSRKGGGEEVRRERGAENFFFFFLVRITGGKLSGRVVSVIKVADGLVISRSALRESQSFSALRRSLVNVNSELDNDKTGPKTVARPALFVSVSTCVSLFSLCVGGKLS